MVADSELARRLAEAQPASLPSNSVLPPAEIPGFDDDPFAVSEAAAPPPPSPPTEPLVHELGDPFCYPLTLPFIVVGITSAGRLSVLQVSRQEIKVLEDFGRDQTIVALSAAANIAGRRGFMMIADAQPWVVVDALLEGMRAGLAAAGRER